MKLTCIVLLYVNVISNHSNEKLLISACPSGKMLGKAKWYFSCDVFCIYLAYFPYLYYVILRKKTQFELIFIHLLEYLKA